MRTILNLEGILARKKLIISQVFGRAQEHVDHYVVQISLGTRPPLHNNEQRKISKQTIQEYHLRNKLMPNKELI